MCVYGHLLCTFLCKFYVANRTNEKCLQNENKFNNIKYIFAEQLKV